MRALKSRAHAQGRAVRVAADRGSVGVDVGVGIDPNYVQVAELLQGGHGGRTGY